MSEHVALALPSCEDPHRLAGPQEPHAPLWDALADAVEMALGDVRKASSSDAFSFVIPTIERLKETGAPEAIWRPLIEHALAEVDGRDRLWARLQLLLAPRVLPVEVPAGAVPAELWVGYDPQVIETARASGDEEDFARTLFVHPWHSVEEIESILSTSRSWMQDSSIGRALTFAAESYLYRFGEFARAEALLEELYERALARNSLLDQAKASVRLALAQFALGTLTEAASSVERAEEAVLRLGPGRVVPEHPGDVARDIYPAASMEANFACFFDGDWPAIARHWSAAAKLPERRGVALVEVGMAAFAHARAGERSEAIVLLDALTRTLDHLQPTVWAVNGAVGRAARAVWTLELAEFADDFRRFALNLIDAGVGNWPTVSNAQTVACMASLLGDLPEAKNYFDRARAELIPAAHRPQRAIIDFDEAVAFRRLGGAAGEQTARDLLRTTADEFSALNMKGWRRRAEAELVLLDRRRANQGVSRLASA
jgi:tetratricopeptide (TPR) repeat protein